MIVKTLFQLLLTQIYLPVYAHLLILLLVEVYLRTNFLRQCMSRLDDNNNTVNDISTTNSETGTDLNNMNEDEDINKARNEFLLDRLGYYTRYRLTLINDNISLREYYNLISIDDHFDQISSTAKEDLEFELLEWKEYAKFVKERQSHYANLYGYDFKTLITDYECFRNYWIQTHAFDWEEIKCELKIEEFWKSKLTDDDRLYYTYLAHHINQLMSDSQSKKYKGNRKISPVGIFLLESRNNTVEDWNILEDSVKSQYLEQAKDFNDKIF